MTNIILLTYLLIGLVCEDFVPRLVLTGFKSIGTPRLFFTLKCAVPRVGVLILLESRWGCPIPGSRTPRLITTDNRLKPHIRTEKKKKKGWSNNKFHRALLSEYGLLSCLRNFMSKNGRQGWATGIGVPIYHSTCNWNFGMRINFVCKCEVEISIYSLIAAPMFRDLL